MSTPKIQWPRPRFELKPRLWSCSFLPRILRFWLQFYVPNSFWHILYKKRLDNWFLSSKINRPLGHTSHNIRIFPPRPCASYPQNSNFYRVCRQELLMLDDARRNPRKNRQYKLIFSANLPPPRLEPSLQQPTSLLPLNSLSHSTPQPSRPSCSSDLEMVEYNLQA